MQQVLRLETSNAVAALATPAPLPGSPPRNFGRWLNRSSWARKPASPGVRCPMTPSRKESFSARSSNHWLSSSQGLASTTTVPTTPSLAVSLRNSAGQTGR